MVTNPTTKMWEDMRREVITPGQTRDQLRYVVMITINSGVLAGIQQTKDNKYIEYGPNFCASSDFDIKCRIQRFFLLKVKRSSSCLCI
jgi:hypothetical protein